MTRDILLCRLFPRDENGLVPFFSPSFSACKSARIKFHPDEVNFRGNLRSHDAFCKSVHRIDDYPVKWPGSIKSIVTATKWITGVA